jgi:ankyrin repeat protein
VDTVQYLLDHGANPDKPDANGSTPLHLAAAGGLSLCILISFLRVRDTMS